VLGEVGPVRPDVGDRPRAAARLLLQPPAPVRVEQQPVLQVGAVDEVRRAVVLARERATQMLDDRVVAVVEADRRHEAARAAGLLGQRDELAGLGGRHAQRLLAQHVLAVGDGIQGDRVVSETAAVIDVNNPLSRRGLYNLDPTRLGFGYGVDGAMTRYVKVPSRCLHKIPDDLSFEYACLTEPCCVAYNAVVENTHIKPGDRVIVLGPGTIGILCGAMAKLCGAEVAVVGLRADKSRLSVAAKYGCETIMGDASAWATERDGLGADCIIDAAGISATMKIALELVRPNGQISKVGWGREPLDFSLDPLVQKNVRLHGSFSHNWPIWERVIALLSSKQLNVQHIVGGVWPITEWYEAFEKMHQGLIVKSVLKPI